MSLGHHGVDVVKEALGSPKTVEEGKYRRGGMKQRRDKAKEGVQIVIMLAT